MAGDYSPAICSIATRIVILIIVSINASIIMIEPNTTLQPIAPPTRLYTSLRDGYA